jgi:hypothetical protein
MASKIAELIVAATATDVCFVHVIDDSGTSLTLAGATPPFDKQAAKSKAPARRGRERLGRQRRPARHHYRPQRGRPPVPLLS